MRFETEYVERLYVFSTTQQAQEISEELAVEFLKENPGISHHEILVQHSVEDTFEVEKVWVEMFGDSTDIQDRTISLIEYRFTINSNADEDMDELSMGIYAVIRALIKKHSKVEYFSMFSLASDLLASDLEEE